MPQKPSLQKELAALHRELAEIRSQLEALWDPLPAMLARRGLPILALDPRDRLLLPAHCPSRVEQDFYQQLRHYAFRLFMRDVIRQRLAFAPQALQRFVDGKTAEDYLAFLLRHRMVRRLSGGRYTWMDSPPASFGNTCEWLVAQVLGRELSIPAHWGVRVGGGFAGGDLDVLGTVEGRLLYVEVKSSPPKNVEVEEVRAYLQRLDHLRPDLTFFLEDTHLRMTDKIVPLFQEALAELRGEASPPQRLRGEIFQVHRIFILNSRPDLATNLRVCLGHALSSIPW